MAYTKLFASIVQSTVWLEDSDTRVVWFTLLALADKNGEVTGSVPGLAHLARVPVEQCRVALDRFMSPDPDSRTPDYDGRRLEKIDGGWSLVNHAKYRRMASKDDQKEKAAARNRRYRQRRNIVTPRDAAVTQRDAAVTQDRDIAEADSYGAAPPNGADPPEETQLHKPSPTAAREPPWGAAPHDGEPIAPLKAVKRMPT